MAWTRRDCMARTVPSANVSMILTLPAWMTDSKPGSDPHQTPHPPLNRSHNGNCVTLEPRPGYNMSHRMSYRRLWHGHCKYNNQTGSKPTSEGEGKKARDSKKAWVRDSGMRNRTPGHRITRRTTLLHTQASDRTPGLKTRAVFFGVCGS